MADKLNNNTNLRDFTPPDPAPIEYDQALKTVGGMPAISKGTNTMDEYQTTAQPKGDLGGMAKFK